MSNYLKVWDASFGSGWKKSYEGKVTYCVFVKELYSRQWGQIATVIYPSHIKTINEFSIDKSG